MTFRMDVFLHDLLGFNFASAALVTLSVSLLAMLLGLAGGLLLALAQQARVRPMRWLAWAYLWLFRGTPALLQVIFAFNVLPGFGLILSGPVCAVLALGLHEAAYMTEIIRSGLGAVGTGQRDGAKALGLSGAQVMRLVVLPQALRVIVPPTGNQFIGMLKLSSLVSVIGVRELVLVAEQSASGNFRYLEALSAAGLYYLAFTLGADGRAASAGAPADTGRPTHRFPRRAEAAGFASLQAALRRQQRPWPGGSVMHGDAPGTAVLHEHLGHAERQVVRLTPVLLSSRTPRRPIRRSRPGQAA